MIALAQDAGRPTPTPAPPTSVAITRGINREADVTPLADRRFARTYRASDREGTVEVEIEEGRVYCTGCEHCTATGDDKHAYAAPGFAYLSVALRHAVPNGSEDSLYVYVTVGQLDRLIELLGAVRATALAEGAIVLEPPRQRRRGRVS